jgi:methanogenesis imperfect marker protein 11
MTVIMTPQEVTKKFGKLFCQGFHTLVDESNGVAQIIDECIARGPVEWDAVNRRRAGGVITGIRVDGYTLIMDAVIGEREVRFGPASSQTGGQGLKALVVDGDEVRTTWVGLAGASVGVGACLPQAEGTLRTEYPDNLRIGGANEVEVIIVTKKMIRVVYAVDDTDTRQEGATWVLMLKLGRSCPVGKFLEHKIIQLNPEVPYKTTNCVSVGISFAVEEKDLERLDDYVIGYIKEHTLSEDTALAIYRGLRIPEELERYGLEAKSRILRIEEARSVAERNDVRIVRITGERGTIGAVAGIGCFDMGLRSSALPADFESLE